MDRLKSNRMFFIFMGLLVAALIASFVYWWIERGNTVKASQTLQSMQGAHNRLKQSDPTQDHVELLETVREDVKETYKEILKTLITWNDYRADAIGVDDIREICRDDIGYKDIKESTIRKWIDEKKLKAFSTPDGSYYVLRKDFEEFLSTVKKSTPDEGYPKEFIEKVLTSSTKVHISETPTLFLGNLQTLQKELENFAKKKNVTLGKQALLLSFDKFLTEAKPPEAEEDLLQLIKQRSAVRDIMYLMIESGVFEIQNIIMTSTLPENIRKTDFFVARDFEVTFVTTYPAIARFLNMILDPRKELVTVGRGVREFLPRNLYVVTDILYKSEEAEMEMKRKQEYETRRRQMEEARRTPTGPTYNPYDMPVVVSRVRGYMRSASDTDEFEKYHKKMALRDAMTKELPGRRPKHNVLKVIMTISFVDLTGDVTGEITQGSKKKNMIKR